VKRVKQVVVFVRSVPEIASLSGADQRAVISASLHRLLLLVMAESNIHFVVAPVLHNTDKIEETHHDRELVSSPQSVLHFVIDSQ